MSQIPGRSPQVQRPGRQIKTAELQWLCYSTPSSFPTGHPSGDIGLCLCVSLLMCVLQGGYSSHWEHREGLKDVGGGEEGACFVLSVRSERLFALFWCNQTPENEKLAIKSCI